MVSLPAPERPRIIELIGPAGAGKSAIANALAKMPGVLCTSIWDVPFRELAWATLSSARSGLMLVRRAHDTLSRELRHIARLRALLNFLDRDALDQYRLVVIDEGAIYTLAWLRVIGHPMFADARSASWFRYHAALWAAELDGVVRLDASDAVLTQRLHNRAKAHVLSHAPHHAVADFTARYRAAFDHVIAAVQRHGRVAVREVRTDRSSPEAIAAQVLRLAPERELVYG